MLGAGPQVLFQQASLLLGKRLERVGAEQLFGFGAVHGRHAITPLAVRNVRIFSRPIRMRLFTVPSGTCIRLAISTCV